MIDWFIAVYENTRKHSDRKKTHKYIHIPITPTHYIHVIPSKKEKEQRKRGNLTKKKLKLVTPTLITNTLLHSPDNNYCILINTRLHT